MKGNKGEGRKNEWETLERETEHERLLTLGKEQVGRGWVLRWALVGGLLRDGSQLTHEITKSP